MDKPISVTPVTLRIDTALSVGSQRESLTSALRASGLWDLVSDLESRAETPAAIPDRFVNNLKALAEVTDRLSDSIAEHIGTEEPSSALKEAECLALRIYDAVDDMLYLVHGSTAREVREESHREPSVPAVSLCAQRWATTYGPDMFEDRGKGEVRIRRFLRFEIGVLKSELHEWRSLRNKTPWEFVPEMLSRQGACEKLRSDYEEARQLVYGTEQEQLSLVATVTNKPLSIPARREQLLRFLLASPEPRPIKELAGLLEVSTTTVLRDVHKLQSLDVPLYLWGNGAYLATQGLSLKQTWMSLDVLRTLAQALRMLPLNRDTITGIVEARRCLSSAYCSELSLALDL